MLALLLLLGGCAPSFDTVDEACDASLAGAELIDDAAAELLARVNCHRRYVGLWPIAVDGQVQQAAQAHLDYLAVNDVLNPDAPAHAGSRRGLLAEAETLPGFTGGGPVERLVTSGAISATDGAAAASVWAWPMREEIDGDGLIAQPWARDLLLQPHVLGVGIARGTVSGRTVAYLDLLGAVPSAYRNTEPVVYPKDGQDGIPPAYLDVDADDSDAFSRTIPTGYPISVTLGLGQAASNGQNPYDVLVREVELVDESGLSVLVSVNGPPHGAPMSVRTSVYVVPLEPLLPETEYRFRAVISTIGGRFDIQSTFRTGPAEDTPPAG